MAKWNRTIATASLLAALCPGVALAQAVEDVDGQGQTQQVGSNAAGLSRQARAGERPCTVIRFFEPGPRGGEPKTQSVEGG
jgi:hypothetical protein